MTKLLLSLHVLAAILAVGPIAVAASMFPRYARQLATSPEAPGATASGAHGPHGDSGEVPGDVSDEVSGEVPGEDAGRAGAGARLLHGVCRVYAVVGVSVPVFGIATGAQLGVLTDAWLIASLILTVAAAALLGLAILPAQERLLTSRTPPPAPGPGSAQDGADAGGGPGGGSGARALAARLAGLTGVFNLLWAVVVVLMIVRPGSTTGA